MAAKEINAYESLDNVFRFLVFFLETSRFYNEQLNVWNKMLKNIKKN